MDLRPGSIPTLRHVSVELSAENGRGLYIPKRFAHGFITLADDTELLYFMSTSHMAGGEGGIGYQDPVLGISWPAVSVISERDEAWAPLKGREAENAGAYVYACEQRIGAQSHSDGRLTSSERLPQGACANPQSHPSNKVVVVT